MERFKSNVGLLAIIIAIESESTVNNNPFDNHILDNHNIWESTGTGISITNGYWLTAKILK